MGPGAGVDEQRALRRPAARPDLRPKTGRGPLPLLGVHDVPDPAHTRPGRREPPPTRPRPCPNSARTHRGRCSPETSPASKFPGVVSTSTPTGSSTSTPGTWRRTRWSGPSPGRGRGAAQGSGRGERGASRGGARRPGCGDDLQGGLSVAVGPGVIERSHSRPENSDNPYSEAQSRPSSTRLPGPVRVVGARP